MVVKIIGLFDVADYAIHVGLFVADIDHSQGQTVISVAFGDGLKRVGIGVGVLPGEVLNGPVLQDHDNQHHNYRAEVDQEVLALVSAEDQVILYKAMVTFQRRVLVVDHQLIRA